MERILYATDLRSHSDRALKRAMMLSAGLEAELLVLHVNSNRSSRSVATAIGELEAQLARLDLPGSPRGVPATPRHRVEIASGDPIKEIVAAVSSFQPDLVVMGPSSELTLVTIFHGTSVEQAVAKISSPILVVKKRPYAPYANVLAAFDHTPGSRRSLELAAGLASNAKFSIVRVCAPEDDLDNIRDMVAGHIEMTARKLPGAPISTSNTEILIRSGNTGDEILKCCAAVEPDLLAFGRSQQTGLKSILPGTTASFLLGHVDCDMLVAGDAGTHGSPARAN